MGGLAFLRLVSPDLAGLTAKAEKLEGEFRFVHSRLREHSESVAFFNGAQTERVIIERHFQELTEHHEVKKRKEHLFGTD